ASGDALAHEADRRAVLAITDAGAAPADPEAPGQDRRQSVRRDQPDRSRTTRHFRGAGPARTRQAARVVAFFRCRTTCYQSFTLLTAELGVHRPCGARRRLTEIAIDAVVVYPCAPSPRLPAGPGSATCR